MAAVIPINVDRNASSRDYRHLKTNELLVTRVFDTFQGEGPFAGWPATFVRLAGCNIGAKQDCPWCDTRFNLDEGKVWTFGELADRLSYGSPHNRNNLVVFTGGEPLLQWDAIATLARSMNEVTTPPHVCQVETNGLLLKGDKASERTGIHYVVSPKIPHNKERYSDPNDDWFRVPYGKLSFKVVLAFEGKYRQLPAYAQDLDHHGIPVYVSGQTVYKREPREGEVASIWDDTLIDREATARNYRYAAEVALLWGFRVSYQSHLFGAQE